MADLYNTPPASWRSRSKLAGGLEPGEILSVAGALKKVERIDYRTRAMFDVVALQLCPASKQLSLMVSHADVFLELKADAQVMVLEAISDD